MHQCTFALSQTCTAAAPCRCRARAGLRATCDYEGESVQAVHVCRHVASELFIHTAIPHSALHGIWPICIAFSNTSVARWLAHTAASASVRDCALVACNARRSLSRHSKARVDRVAVQILQGQKDTRVEPDFTRQFHREAQAQDKTLLEYEHAYHQLLQDSSEVVEKTLQDLTEWLSARV